MDSLFFVYLAMGAIASFFSGLLGIGGATFFVPVLLLGLKGIVPDNDLMFYAIGTSISAIVFTSALSIKAHIKNQAVCFDSLRFMVIGAVIGTILGLLLVFNIDAKIQKPLFGMYLFLIGVQMMFHVEPKDHHIVPGKSSLFGIGFASGVFSGIIGIAGATLIVPALKYFGFKLKQSIGTAIAVSIPIAIVSSVIYISMGSLGASQPGFAGYVYVPALIAFVIPTFIAAPYGAALAHRIHVNVLQNIFSVILFLIGGAMVFDVI